MLEDPTEIQSYIEVSPLLIVTFCLAESNRARDQTVTDEACRGRRVIYEC